MRDSRRIRSFHDLPLWVKALLAPLACLVAAVAVVASIWLGTTATEVRLAAVADEALPTAAASAGLLDQVDGVHVMAMRALVWQQAGVPQATIDGLIADIGHGLDTLRASTASMAANRAEGDTDLPRLRQIAAQSVAYAKLLGDALDLIADPPIAVGYFRRADAAFAALRGDIAGLSATGRAAEAASIQSARGSSHAALVRSWWILGVSGVLMLVLLPIVVAEISRPVRSLTRTMTDLVNGDMTAEVTGHGNRDELGDMARAVLVFKEHMVRGIELAAEKEAASRRAEAEKRTALVGMAEKIETETGAALREIELRTSAMVEAADAMNSSAVRPGASARNATDAASQALANARSVASAAEQLTDAIREISRQVGEFDVGRQPRGFGRWRNPGDDRSAQSGRGTDRRGRRHHRRNRFQNEPAGAERDNRGGACRRRGPRLRGGRLRGQGARQPDRAFDRGNRGPHREGSLGDGGLGHGGIAHRANHH